jgi:sulfur carrier protein
MAKNWSRIWYFPVKPVSDLAMAIQIMLNGEARQVREGSIADLVASLGLDVKKVAVERNREIVPRSTLADVALVEGDALEIVHFVGGGC